MEKSNQSFAARLRRAQDMQTILRGYEGFTPPRTEESHEGFERFNESLVQINQSVTNGVLEYRSMVGKRRDDFYNNANSISKLFPALRSAIRSQYGKYSTEVALLDTIIDTMRYRKFTVSTEEQPVTVQEKFYRSGEKSFGSMTKNLHDFITTIAGFQGYQPGNDEFKLEGLNEKLANINSLNDSVIQKYSELRTIKKERLDLYRQLKERTDRIKEYVRSKYGANSFEYAQIRSMRFQ